VCSAELNQAKKAQTAEKILNAEERTEKVEADRSDVFSRPLSR
jgi:hypothetical protein